MRTQVRPILKGRAVDPKAREEVLRLLGDAPRRRDLLIEHLHRINDRFGYLPAAHLAALAAEMGLALTEVYEVATFYHHFEVVKESETPPPALTVRVCDSIACELAGAGELLKKLSLGKDVRVVTAPCVGRCEVAPCAVVGQNPIGNATVDAVKSAVARKQTGPDKPQYLDYSAYRATGGYNLIAECLAGKRTREDVTKIMEDSALRGLGGAGFPAGRKWRLVAAEPAPRVMALNMRGSFNVLRAAGRIMTFLAAPDRDCIDNMPTSKHPPLGSCYVSDNRNQYDIEPGQTYTLRITLADGGVLTSSTRVPASFTLLRPAITPCAVAAHDTFSIRWTSSPDAWVYAGEAAIAGLQDILGAQGKKIDDPLRLFGLSASSRDTTILFPTEFGLFQRFDADLTDALVAISRGLPAGTGAVVTIAAADRNYVNWERGGDFNPSGAVRIPSIRGAGTGVFGSLVPHTVRIQAGASDLPGC